MPSFSPAAYGFKFAFSCQTSLSLIATQPMAQMIPRASKFSVKNLAKSKSALSS
jgi:hypothetical protein